jgi:hypothetical protein
MYTERSLEPSSVGGEHTNRDLPDQTDMEAVPCTAGKLLKSGKIKFQDEKGPGDLGVTHSNRDSTSTDNGSQNSQRSILPSVSPSVHVVSRRAPSRGISQVSEAFHPQSKP